MRDSREHLTQRLDQEGQKVLAFYRDLPAGQWDERIYLAGSGWDTRRVLAHFVSAERAFHRLFSDVLAGGRGTPEGFDIDAFNEDEVGAYPELDASSLLDAFHEVRRATIRLVETMSAEDLQRSGRHPWFGVVAVEEMLKLIYRHNQIHLRDIRKVLATGQPLPADDGV